MGDFEIVVRKIYIVGKTRIYKMELIFAAEQGIVILKIECSDLL